MLGRLLSQKEPTLNLGFSTYHLCDLGRMETLLTSLVFPHLEMPDYNDSDRKKSLACILFLCGNIKMCGSSHMGVLSIK